MKDSEEIVEEFFGAVAAVEEGLYDIKTPPVREVDGAEVLEVKEEEARRGSEPLAVLMSSELGEDKDEGSGTSEDDSVELGDDVVRALVLVSKELAANEVALRSPVVIAVTSAAPHEAIPS